MFSRKFAESNRMLPCKVPGCNRLREQVSAFCRKHKHKASYHGDPLAEPVTVKEFTPYLAQVSDIVNKNLDHPGIIQAIGIFDLWLKLASQGIPCSALAFVERLADIGIPPIQLVKIAGAAYWYTHSNPKRILTVRHRTFFVANQIFRASHPGGRGNVGCGFKKQASGKDRAEAGNYVHEHLSVLMANIVLACENQEREQEKRLKEQYIPLKG
jgi:hypothetical protein